MAELADSGVDVAGSEELVRGPSRVALESPSGLESALGLVLLGPPGGLVHFMRDGLRKAKVSLVLENRSSAVLTCRLRSSRLRRFAVSASRWYLEPGERLGVTLACFPFRADGRTEGDFFRLFAAALPQDLAVRPARAYHVWKPSSPLQRDLDVFSLKLPVTYESVPQESSSSESD